MSFLNDLNPVQRDAVMATDGPVMIIAGAGSGKTRVLTYRIAHLMDKGMRPEAILALTFTNKAASEMKRRIEELIGRGCASLWMGTFHSIFARILRFECHHIGYDRNYTIYDKDDSLTLIRSIQSDFGIPQQQFVPSAILSRISRAKNAMITVRDFTAQARDPFAERAATVFAEYEARLKKSNAMDFDDLLLKPLLLFANHPAVLQKYRTRFRSILVDEYQDTNRVQYRLIRTLAEESRNICVVGDDAQSIYGFRGADIRNILDFESDYSDARIFRLEQNYRSSKAILSAADSVIRHNEDRITKTLWTENPEGEHISLVASQDDLEEGHRVVVSIREEIRKKKLDLSHFAVLYRTNAQSRSIEDAMRRSGIPYIMVGGVAFYKRKEIKDILAYLKVIANPSDDESLMRIVNVPLRSIGTTTLGKLRGFAVEHSLSLFNALGSESLPLSISSRTREAIRGLANLLRKYTDLKTKVSVSELARMLVDDLGILGAYKNEGTQEALERRANVMELLSALDEFNERNRESGLEEFLSEVSLVSDVDTADFGRNAVTLMTLHAAKGLEFPVVFITGLEEGLFPMAGATSDRQELEEERRLLYVGITRAQHKLYLSYARSRFQFGERTYSVRSRFLDEIGDHLVEEQATGSTQSHRRPLTTGARGGFAERTRYRTRDTDVVTDPMPDYENESQEYFRPQVGSRVLHEAFGKGRIVSIDGKGENARAVVDFESVGRKHLMLKFAQLKGGQGLPE